MGLLGVGLRWILALGSGTRSAGDRRLAVTEWNVRKALRKYGADPHLEIQRLGIASAQWLSVIR